MKNVLLIQTGGTIGMDIMAGDDRRLDAAKANRAIIKKIPELSQIADIETVCPFFKDSSDVGPDEWKQLIACIDQHYERYDGFVILHGTDTMAYTASALSFGLQELAKPVIFTGSQVPMASLRSDARRNLVNAIEMATLALPEVALCFNDFIYRGNRTTKMSIGDFDAFASPNFPPLAEIGLNIRLSGNIKKSKADAFQTTPHFSDEVFLLKIYPGFSPKRLQQFDFSGIKVILIEAFGSGNFPLAGQAGLESFLKKSINQGLYAVITSQAPYDAVDLSKYESGRAAANLGAIGAGDMTTEAALTKIMYILGAENETNFRQRFQSNLAGELSI